MTKNEILEYFKDINHAYNDCMRYDTLKRMLDELQEPCTDAISRAEVLEIYDEWFATCNIADKKESPKAKIKALPSVTPQPKMEQESKTGHWITCNVLQEVKCSECRVCFRHITNYCPNCGAKMQEVGE